MRTVLVTALLALLSIVPAAQAEPAGFLSGHTNSTVLVMGPSGIPTPSQQYLDSVDRIYLQPLGYDGSNLVPLTTPESLTNTAESLAQDEQILYEAVMKELQGSSPVVVFGYSQSAAAASAVERELLAAGVPADMVKFVLIGNSGSQYGILNRIYDSLPDWLQQYVLSMLDEWHLQGVLTVNGVTASDITPTDAYPTVVFTLPHDGYSDWTSTAGNQQDLMQDISGLFTIHEEYMGLTPEDVTQSFANPDVQGMTTYFTLPEPEDMIATLIQAATNVGWL